MKRVAILQSNYIPWKGYFDLIGAVDEFVLYDDMQFTKNDWRNRNKVKTPQGLHWLTIPTGIDLSRRIRDVELPSDAWQAKHFKALEANYRRAPHFAQVAGVIEPLYRTRHRRLSEVNRAFIQAICGLLGIGTRISDSSAYKLIDGKTERLIDLCRQTGATDYFTGPAARDYLDATQFTAAGLKLHWFDYSGYVEYPQLWGKFEHEVTVLDLLFNTGPEARRYLKLGAAAAVPTSVNT